MTKFQQPDGAQDPSKVHLIKAYSAERKLAHTRRPPIMTETPGSADLLFARTIAFVAILLFANLVLVVLLAGGCDVRAALAAATGSAMLAVEIADQLLKA
ncbi:hypothetical protein JIG36_25595 [Actinoplanes sp. LDG1-06]|uniref:Uncharacterized protein n=1 Tax=Paractinoplanes ovalisporus TaxID=2810368 RepID=A0ABS2AHV3_9ACTN|nr:hypothetical protein [Actinoplanes ovalisporus]MBM2618938.1 hypothetical protein [Actinoplanes ovalisporus]